MNIAILSYEYPPDTGFGGIGTYSYYHARALAAQGHRVHVLAGSTRQGIFHSEHDGVRVTRIKLDGWRSRLLEAGRRRRCWWFANRVETGAAAYRGLFKLLEREAVDVVEMPECGGDGLFINTLLPVTKVVRFHSPARLIMNLYDTPRMDREMTSLVEQVAINQADAFTACSAFLAREVTEKMNVRRTVHVIPNGIDLELFDRDEGIDIHERFGLPRGRTMVFFANRIEERKGSHLLEPIALSVLRKYRDVHFVVAGRDLFGHMENRILPALRKERVDSRFHFLGPRELPEVRALLKRTDIFLLPSLWENCPYSCIEAMAAGRAIVSSDCGGMPELIDDRRTGLLATNNDSSAFIRALEEAIEDQGLRTRLGREARKAVESRLTDEVVARSTLRVYAAVAGTSGE